VEQSRVPGAVYLAGYLLLVPLLIYYPTHLALQWWNQHKSASAQPDKVAHVAQPMK
jgi:hypothetical protein